MKYLNTQQKPIAALAACLIAGNVWAQSSNSSDPIAHVIVSSGFADKGYDVDKASSVTRTGARLIETPASVEVVDQQLIKDKAILNPAELADVVSGVQSNAGKYGTSSQDFIVRGFSTNGISYRDGYRINSIDSANDMANVERVEFVKGPASVLGGASQPGGAVNVITKKALNYNYAYADIQAGSWDFLRSTVDVNQVFGDVSARLNVSGDKGNSYVNLQSSDNYMIAPTLTWKINSDAELSYSGEFQRTKVNGGYTGLPNLQGVQNLSAGTTMGQPWTNQQNNNIINQGDFKYKFDPDWTFRQGVISASYLSNFNPAITPNFLSPGTIGAAKALAWNQSSLKKNVSSQTELYGNVSTGVVAHKLLFGYEFSKVNYDFNVNTSWSWAFLGQPVNLNNPQYAPNPNDYSLYSLGQDNKTQKSNALYFQDQISWGNWRLLGGIRNERVNTTGYQSGGYTWGGGDFPDTITSPSNISQTESATTGRGGLLYMITPASSVYYSISQSFTPNGSYRGVGGSILPSSRGLQNEVGLKHSFWEGLDGTVSLFQITKSNVPAFVSTGIYTVNGGEQSKGWEASLIGQATKSLRMIANATGINATVTSATYNPNVAATAPAGTQLFGVPKFSANIWGVQDLPIEVPGKVSAGLGVVYVGDRNATTPNTAGLVMPSYTTVDLGIFYKIDKVNLALNVKNLTNATVLNSVQGAYVARQPGTSYLATAGINF
jgi:iron complex outermembrane receptor protein